MPQWKCPDCGWPGGTAQENHAHALAHADRVCLLDCPLRVAS